MATRTGSDSNNRKYMISVAAVALVAVGAYGVGRVYPPLGPTAGTITPAERYVSSQVGEGDVTLGDTSVAELMQTDVFELMVKDPDFRSLAASPGFQVLASAARRDGRPDVQSGGVQLAGRQSQRLRRPGQSGAGCVVAGAPGASGERELMSAVAEPSGGDGRACFASRSFAVDRSTTRPTSPTSRPTPTHSATPPPRPRRMHGWRTTPPRSSSSPTTMRR